MIQKLGEAFKKMAQRNLLRGDRGAANAISDHGIHGMRSVLGNNKNDVADKTAQNQNVQPGTSAQYSPIKNINVAQKVETSQNLDKKLGGNILDAIK